MKKHILTLIYTTFDHWLDQWDFVCQKGCSACCTQNVTMTGLEGEHIRDFIQERQQEEWFRGILQSVDCIDRPGPTTNEFAASCLQGEEIEQPLQAHLEPCPFLVEHCCTIYEVRPFNCRCFVSFEKCGPNHAAVVHEYILSASTALMQIIEHLDQRGQWGNMLDILRMQTDHFQDNKQISQQIHECKTLPGFLIPPEDFDKVQPLLESIFSAQVNGKSVETILNGG